MYVKDSGPNRVYMIEIWHGSGTGQNVLLIGSDWNERTLTLRPDRGRKAEVEKPPDAPDRDYYFPQHVIEHTPTTPEVESAHAKNTAELEIKLSRLVRTVREDTPF